MQHETVPLPKVAIYVSRVLSAVDQGDLALSAERNSGTFKAAIAFYPQCFVNGTMSTPTLILIGEADDWPSLTPAGG
jgi:hypothetical protein